MKALSNSDKIKVFISPKMIDIITFLDNNGISVSYTGLNICGIYRYPEMIGYPTKLTTSSQSSHNFVSSSSIKNDIESLHPFIADIRMIQKSI